MTDYSNLTKPFQGTIWYWEETSYGAGQNTRDKHGESWISDVVNDVRIDSGDKHKSLRGINSAAVVDFVSTVSDPVLHIEWVSQATAYSLATLCVDRSSNGTLASVAFCIGVNTDSTSSDSYYLATGCIAKNLNLSGSGGNEYVYSADFSVKTITQSGAATGAAPNASGVETTIGGTYGVFNVAGGITQTGGTQAFITDSVDITVENNLKDYWDSDSIVKQYAIPGAKDITGSVDISLDDGGNIKFAEVVDRTAITSIAIDTGTGILATHTATTVEWDNLSIDVNTSGEGMMSSVPFTAKTFTIA